MSVLFKRNVLYLSLWVFLLLKLVAALTSLFVLVSRINGGCNLGGSVSPWHGNCKEYKINGGDGIIIHEVKEVCS